MADGFYLADETHKTITGKTVELKGLLYFKLARAEFDSKATKEHVKNYGILFGEFLDKHPDFKLPESFLRVEEAGSPSVSVSVHAPVAEAPVVEAPVVEAPVVEAPVVEAPVVEAPVVEAPVVEEVAPEVTE